MLFVRRAATLVVADLVHNIGRPTGRWTRFYTGLMGFYDRVAISRLIRWGAFSDRAAARRSLDAVLELPFEHIVVGHGEPILRVGRRTLEEAYGWLPLTRAMPARLPEPRPLPSRRAGAPCG